MEQLSPIDKTFLDVDEAGPPLAIAAVMILEGPAPTIEELREVIGARAPRIPRFHQQLMSMPYDMVRPIWVDAETIDLSHHVRHVSVPAPGRMREMEGLVSDLVTFPMDHDRPLWDAWLLDGMQEDRWAMMVRVHHAAVDGVGGVMMMLHLFDDDSEEEPEDADVAADTGGDNEPEQDEHPEHPSDEVRAIASAIDQQVRHLAGRLNGLVGSARPGDLTHRATETLRGLSSALAAVASPTHSALSGPVGPDRRWVTASVPLDDIRPIRRRFGGTVNDVALTAVAGAVRDLLSARGERLSDRMVKVFVPVSARSESDALGTNLISGMVAELPVGDIDPVDRLRSVAAHLRQLKSSGESAAIGALLAAASWAPTPIARAGVRFGASHVIGMIDTIATNVPGPPFPVHLGGRRVVAIYPYVPIREPLRMTVGIFSYDGSLYIGVTGDTASLPDLEAVPRAFVRTVGELLERSRRAVGRQAGDGVDGAPGAEGAAPG